MSRLAPSDPRPHDAPDQDPRWQDLAACKGCDPDLFFPERGGSTREAKEVCRSCPVQTECAEAGRPEKFGIWGGKSERERRVQWRGKGRVRVAMPRAYRVKKCDHFYHPSSDSCYTNHGCRCDECCANHSYVVRLNRQRKKAS